MKRKSPFGFLALSFVAITTCALALHFVAVMDPESALGENLFQWEYAHADDKSAYLQTYRARMWEHGGGYVPDNAARFFAARLDDSRSHGDEEVAAIARFYASQGGMREGNFGQLLSERARQQLVDAILRDWRTYPEKNAWRGFVFIEGLRQNAYIGKSYISGGEFPDSYQKLSPIAAKFEGWNRRFQNTPVVKRPNPLLGTPYTIEGL